MNKVVKEWEHAKEQLDTWKKAELALREKVIAQYPGEPGTTHVEGKDFKLTITRGVTYSLDEAALSVLWEDLPAEEKNCVKYKPALDVRRFKDLGESKLAEVVIKKPTLPTVAIKHD
jgi:hypothetical protein